MKNFFLFLFVLLLGGITFIAVGVFALTASPLDDWEGSVELNIITADVSVKQGNLDYQIVTESLSLAEGDMIKTDKNGEAEILIGDGAVIRLAPETELVINKTNLDSLWEQNVNVAVNQGKIWFRIIKIFDEGSSWEVETPTVVATVRGTAFGLEISDDDNVDFVVAESEVFIREKEKTIKGKEAVVVAGQKMTVARNFAIVKDQLNLDDKKNPELRTWLNNNLELDKKFQAKTQQKVNAELLKNLKKEPGTLIYEAQLWAEKLRLKISDDETIERLEALQEKRRIAETLWLAEKGEEINLQKLLERPGLDGKLLERLDKLPQLMIDPDSKIERFFDMDVLERNTFDLKTLENNIQKLDLNILEDKFNFDMELNILRPEALEDLKRAMIWLKNHPGITAEMKLLSDRIDNLPQNDMEALSKLFNSSEYLELLERMENRQEIILNENARPLFVLDPESFDDFTVAMEWIDNNPEIQEQIEKVSLMAEKIDENDEIAIERFLTSPEYLELLKSMEEIPGFTKVEYSEMQFIEPMETRYFDGTGVEYIQ